MTEMVHGETVIKVMPAKVDEMLRKGWAIKTHEPVVESEEIIIEDDDSEEE
jgi:hypothetical protein